MSASAATLGDSGGRIIAIESPSSDPSRTTLPTQSAGMGQAFPRFGRNKRSRAIDMKAPAAREAFRGLVAGANLAYHL